MKALVGAFNQEKARVGAFSVIVKTGCGTDGSIFGTKLVLSHSSCARSADMLLLQAEEVCGVHQDHQTLIPANRKIFVDTWKIHLSSIYTV